MAVRQQDCLADVADSAAWVAAQAQHVRIDQSAVIRAAAAASTAELNELRRPQWDTDIHFRGSDEATAQYLLVLDALNFCFWPQPGLEYEHLARGLKESLEADASALDAERLLHIDGPALQALLRRPEPVPLQDERARLLREVGMGLLDGYDGRAEHLITAAAGSAGRLVQLVAAAFPGFRDHAIYRGRQIFLYKRAQIFAADVWGAFGGAGLGAFHDLPRLTTFADYRVPVVLRQLGILCYSAELTAKVDSRQEIAAGSAEEVEIRACTIAAVEALRIELSRRLRGSVAAAQTPPLTQAPADIGGRAPESAASAAAAAPAEACPPPGSSAAGKPDAAGSKHGSASPEDGASTEVSYEHAATAAAAAMGPSPAAAAGPDVTAVSVDWWLWGRGEAERETAPPHHRTLTIFY